MINFSNNFQSQSRSEKSQRFTQDWRLTRDLGRKSTKFYKAEKKGLVERWIEVEWVSWKVEVGRRTE